MKTLTATPTVMNRLSKDAQSQINQAKRQAIIDIKKAQANDVEKDDDEPKKAKTPEKVKTPKTTKKMVVIEFLEKDGGTIQEIAQAITDMGLDPDVEKNQRVVRLWISKIGFKVERLEGGVYKKM